MLTAADLASAVQAELRNAPVHRPRFRLPAALVAIASAAIAVVALALLAS